VQSGAFFRKQIAANVALIPRCDTAVELTAARAEGPAIALTTNPRGWKTVLEMGAPSRLGIYLRTRLKLRFRETGSVIGGQGLFKIGTKRNSTSLLDRLRLALALAIHGATRTRIRRLTGCD
jgi:hypothetical protein